VEGVASLAKGWDRERKVIDERRLSPPDGGYQARWDEPGGSLAPEGSRIDLTYSFAVLLAERGV